MTSTPAIAESYREQRRRDWETFAAGSAPLADHWARWAERSHDWKVPMEFVQPFGLDYPGSFVALEPLFAELRELPGVDVPPVEWLHATWVRVGFMRAEDILWSQLETFYVNAATRLRRLPQSTVRLGGIAVADDERIYLGIDDGGLYREARRVTALGVPKVREVLHEETLVTAGVDHYIPTIDIAYFTGAGSRARVMQALEPYRDVDLGEVQLTHTKMARMPILPHSHYETPDVVAEIPLLGAAHRGGYHN